MTPSKPIRRATNALGPLLGIGLLVSASQAGQFDKKPFSAEEKETMSMLAGQAKADGDLVAKLELAKLYSLHNHLDEAKPLLEEVLAKEPKNPEAVAWDGANTARIAGRAIPWDMGIRKIILAKRGLRRIEEAMALDSANFDVRVTAIITGAGVKRFGGLERAKPRMQRLLAEVDDPAKGYTKDAKAAIYLAASHVALAEGDAKAAREHADKARGQEPAGFVKMQVDDLFAGLGPD